MSIPSYDGAYGPRRRSAFSSWRVRPTALPRAVLVGRHGHVHEALVEVALGRRRGAPELLEQLVRVEAPAVAHEGESLGDARRLGHFREDRRMQRAPVVSWSTAPGTGPGPGRA